MKKKTPPSFSSLPHDVALNIIARISRIHYPTLSLVSKSFRKILSCRDLYVTRTLIEKTEDFVYVYLNLNYKNPDPRWFALSLIPKQQILIPMPSFPYAKDSTVLSTGSEIYIIGGTSKEGERSKQVFVMDTRSHQCRRLPDMSVGRIDSAARVIDGKLYVTDLFGEVWGEVYDPKTQTWKPLLEKKRTLTIQMRMVPGKFVMARQVYSRCSRIPYSRTRSCSVEVENKLYDIYIHSDGTLGFCSSTSRIQGLEDLSCCSSTSRIQGLEGLPCALVAVANPSKGRRVTVWWMTTVAKCRGFQGEYYDQKTNIWCAEISFKKKGTQDLRGFVEWSKEVFGYDGCGNSSFFLDSATSMPH